MFDKGRQPQNVDELIRRIADHNRPADYVELYVLLPTLKLYFPVSPSAAQSLPKGRPFKVGQDADLRLQCAAVQGRRLAVLYTSPADERLGAHYAEIEGDEALRMALRMPDAEGLLIQARGTAWVGIEKQKIADVLRGAV
jgi:hypothetical protein